MRDVFQIEVTAFVSPKAIPALVPNVRGCERGPACGVDEINVVMSASDGPGRANLRMTSERSLAGFDEVVKFVRESSKSGSVPANVALSTAFGCPFDGAVAPARVLDIVGRCEQWGLTGVILRDTTGVAHPAQVAQLCAAVRARHPALQITAHFHATRGMGLANALAALDAGIDRYDASLGGLGGCPFAPGASGNVCTEDLVHMFEAMGCDTGVDLERLVAAARERPGRIGHEVPGQVLKAGPFDRRYPLPR